MKRKNLHIQLNYAPVGTWGPVCSPVVMVSSHRWYTTMFHFQDLESAPTYRVCPQAALKIIFWGWGELVLTM